MTQDHIQTLIRIVSALAKREPTRELRFSEDDLTNVGVCAFIYDDATKEIVLRWFDPESQAGDAEAMVKDAALRLAQQKEEGK